MSSSHLAQVSRRRVLGLGIAAAGAATLAGAATESPHAAGEADEISPTEDLMREHGVLTRILLVYGTVADRLDAADRELSPEPLHRSAALVRRFVEDYHERLEEQHLFPRFEKAHTLVELVATLRAEHDAGRRLTDTITGLATPAAFGEATRRTALARTLRQFIRMYEPHAAREDTVLFPAFRALLRPQELAELGEDFERKEHELFGKDGFRNVVGEVAGIERQLGIHDLAGFTPRP